MKEKGKNLNLRAKNHKVKIFTNFDCRFDFVLNAVQKSGIYRMKFGGLFDCAKPKIHGLGLLIYDNVASDIEAAFSEMETNYEDFVNIEGTIVNPLNYAPPSLTPQVRMPKTDERHLRVPISQLEHLPSPKLNDSSYFSFVIQESIFDFFFDIFRLCRKNSEGKT